MKNFCLNCHTILPELQKIRLWIAHYHRRLSKFLKLQTKLRIPTTVHRTWLLCILPPQCAASLRYCFLQCKWAANVLTRKPDIVTQEKFRCKDMSNCIIYTNRCMAGRSKNQIINFFRNMNKIWESLWLNICHR
jgi:hypothetical protein